MTKYFPLFAVLLLLAGACKSEETQVSHTETTLTQTTATEITSLPPADDPLATLPTETAAASPVVTGDATTAGEPTATASKLPKNHNVDHGGTMHAPGAKEDAAKKCGACHGKDLKGGKTAPSCFDCHEQKWS